MCVETRVRDRSTFEIDGEECRDAGNLSDAECDPDVADQLFGTLSSLEYDALLKDSDLERHPAMETPSVRAPDFPDTLDWIHTGGRRLTLADFRGKLLLLDFWTYG